MASTESPRRGEVWLVSFGAGRGGEPGRNRPAIVISVDQLATGAAADLVAVIPVSSSRELGPLRPIVTTGEGVDRVSVAVCRAIRSVNRGRLLRRVGVVAPPTIAAVEDCLALILGLRV